MMNFNIFKRKHDFSEHTRVDFYPNVDDICYFQVDSRGKTMGIGNSYLGKKCRVIRTGGQIINIDFDISSFDRYGFACIIENLLPLDFEERIERQKKLFLLHKEADPYGEEIWEYNSKYIKENIDEFNNIIIHISSCEEYYTLRYFLGNLGFFWSSNKGIEEIDPTTLYRNSDFCIYLENKKLCLSEKEYGIDFYRRHPDYKYFEFEEFKKNFNIENKYKKINRPELDPYGEEDWGFYTENKKEPDPKNYCRSCDYYFALSRYYLELEDEYEKERVRKKINMDKRKKRTYSEIDPYGEEKWNEAFRYSFNKPKQKDYDIDGYFPLKDIVSNIIDEYEFMNRKNMMRNLVQILDDILASEKTNNPPVRIIVYGRISMLDKKEKYNFIIGGFEYFTKNTMFIFGKQDAILVNIDDLMNAYINKDIKYRIRMITKDDPYGEEDWSY